MLHSLYSCGERIILTTCSSTTALRLVARCTPPNQCSSMLQSSLTTYFISWRYILSTCGPLVVEPPPQLKRKLLCGTRPHSEIPPLHQKKAEKPQHHPLLSASPSAGCRLVSQSGAEGRGGEERRAPVPLPLLLTAPLYESETEANCGCSPVL